MGADAILEALKKEGIKGEVKACCNPVAMPDGDVSVVYESRLQKARQGIARVC